MDEEILAKLSWGGHMNSTNFDYFSKKLVKESELLSDASQLEWKHFLNLELKLECIIYNASHDAYHYPSVA